MPTLDDYEFSVPDLTTQADIRKQPDREPTDAERAEFYAATPA